MTTRQPSQGEDTQTERVSGQPVDSKAALWRPEGTEPAETTDVPEPNGREEAEPASITEPVQRGE